MQTIKYEKLNSFATCLLPAMQGYLVVVILLDLLPLWRNIFVDINKLSFVCFEYFEAKTNDFFGTARIL